MNFETTKTVKDRREAVPGRVLVEIRRRLRSTGHHSLRGIEIECDEGGVVLRGRVSTYYLKQVAQSVLLNDPAIRSVVNLIEVSENGDEDRFP